MSVGQQGVTDILTFLLREYAAHLAAVNQEAIEKAKERVLAMSEITAFRTFAHNYLLANRPSSLTHAEANYVIQFTNGKTTAICPGMDQLKGTMQPSSYIPVTGRETAMEMLRNATGMRGEMTPMGGPTDLTHREGPKRFDL